MLGNVYAFPDTPTHTYAALLLCPFKTAWPNALASIWGLYYLSFATFLDKCCYCCCLLMIIIVVVYRPVVKEAVRNDIYFLLWVNYNIIYQNIFLWNAYLFWFAHIKCMQCAAITQTGVGTSLWAQNTLDQHQKWVEVNLLLYFPKHIYVAYGKITV